MALFIFFYIYFFLVILNSLEEVMTVKVCKLVSVSWRHCSPLFASVPQLFVGEYTEVGLPRPIAPSLVLPFSNSCSPPQG